MIIIKKKNKEFSSPDPQTQEVTSRDLQIEQMKMQRQILQTQRLREKLAAQERRDFMKSLEKSQRNEIEQKNDQTKNQISLKKIDTQDDSAKNVSLYKTRSKVVTPVPMKT